MKPSDRLIRFLAPIVFWTLIILVKLIRVLPLTDSGNLIYNLITIATTTSLELIAFSLFYFFLIPNLFLKQKWGTGILVSVVFLILFGAVWSWTYSIIGRATILEDQIVYYKASLGHNILSIVYAFVLRFSVDWLEQFKKQKEITEQQIKSELAILRSQINPHFLFNTLNNINSFSLTNPEKASFAIIKLSEIMRYMLYDAKDEMVPLEKEVTYIRNYLSLQKLRFKNPEFVKCEINDEIGHVFVPPLLFITFIENAFKHGKTSITDGINILLVASKRSIHFECKNHIRDLNDTEKHSEKGTGIENTKRRLELLYPGRHQLIIEADQKIFQVKLNIQLDEN